MSERIGILAFQGDVHEHAQIMTHLGARASLVRSREDFAGLDGLIIPGGESTTIDKLSQIFGVAEPLKEKITAGFPVFGSCAGMVMLADTIADPQRDSAGVAQKSFGGINMVVARNVFGRQADSFEANIEFAGIANPAAPFPAVFIRAPWAKSVGNGAEVLGRVTLSSAVGVDPSAAEDPNPVVAVRQKKLLATSFHPEITEDPRIHKLFLDIIREEV